MLIWKDGKGFGEIDKIFKNCDNLILINGVTLFNITTEVKMNDFGHKEVNFKTGNITVASIDFKEYTKYEYATNEDGNLSILRIED